MRVRSILEKVSRPQGIGSLLLLLIAVLTVAFSWTDSDDFMDARREILLRRVGHEVLLLSGDSTARVLPVKKVREHTYQISFERPFSFQPETLVNTTSEIFAKDPSAQDYVVKVLNCADGRVVYGYAISNQHKEDIIACLGRKQPLACYQIQIQFKSVGILTARHGYVLAGILALAFLGVWMTRPGKPKTEVPEVELPTGYPLGSMYFDAAGRTLSMDGKITELTKTETRVLSIFASAPNEVIERSRLQKEIWEDEGVIVGRSLDMFISKLRKKLEPDPNISIVVIRGKGYRLEIAT